MNPIQRDRDLRRSLTPDRVCDLLALHGPATAKELAAAASLDLTPFHSAQGNCIAVAAAINRARRQGHPILRRLRDGRVNEYALATQVEESQGPVYDHGGWE